MLRRIDRVARAPRRYSVISQETSRTLASTRLADLGLARRVRDDKDASIIVEGHGGKQAIRAMSVPEPDC